MPGAILHYRRGADGGGSHSELVNAASDSLWFFVLIVATVLLGSHLFGPDSWPIRSDRKEARRARVDAEHAEELRQRLRGAILGG